MFDPHTNAQISAPERLTLSSPDALLAAVPHLLGFPVRNSVVLVGLVVDASGRELIHLTQRFDRPSVEVLAESLPLLAKSAAQPMIASGSQSVIIAVFGDENPVIDGVLPSSGLVDDLVEALDDGRMWVKDALYTDGASRWSYGCENAACCPIEGAPISDGLRTLVAAEFAGAGAAMAPSRQAIVDGFAAAPEQVAHVAKLLPVHGGSPGGLEQWRDAAISTIAALRSDPAPAPNTVAAVIVGLKDIRVRDTALWELAHDDSDKANVISALTIALRSAPEGNIAPVATALAIQHWTRGDGARANACLDRAVADDPNYSLAAMVGTAIGRGLPPSAWTDVIRQLDRGTCRKPVDAGAAQTPARSPLAPLITAPAPSLAG